MAILLSLLAAAAYGLADFVGGVTSKRASPWSVALVAQLGGASLVLVLAAFTEGTVTSTDLWWTLVAGIANGFGTAFLYRGLSSGRMGVVAPVSGVGAVLVPVVVGLVTGERPPALVWVGILAALPGIWLVAREPVDEDVTGALPTSSGVVDGVLAGLGFGSLFAALAQIPEEAGFLPLALNQLVAAAAIVAVALVLRQDWVPRQRAALLGVVSGGLGALATGAFMVAAQTGYLSVTAVLASLYPAFTVLLAATVLREHVHRHQAVGLALCAAAVSLVAGGGSDKPAEVDETPQTVTVTGTSPSAGDSPTAPSPAPSPTAQPAVRRPSVLVVHHARGDLTASPGLARRIRRGDVASWTALDGASDRLRVVGSVAAVARDPEAVAFVRPGQVRPWVRAVRVGTREPLRGDRLTTLTVVGDIMLDRGVAAAAPDDDPVAPLRPLRRLLAGADLTVGNLESALSENGAPQQGDDSFAAPPSVLDGLAALGVDALSLANNHTGDYGEQALLDTVAAVRRSPVAGFGAGVDRAAATRPAVLRTNGVRFGFVGFNAIGETPQAGPAIPGALSIRMPPRTGPLDRGDLAHVVRTVRRLDRRVDVVVVIPHWGTQYTHVAEPVQTQVARRLAAAGADLVAGGHPHWVQGLERAGDTVVAHSLGNLVFDMDFMEQTMEGVALTATFWRDRLVAVDLTPYRMDAGFSPREVTGAEAADILGDVWSHSRGVFRSP